jgi:hypothetical protein
VGQAQRRPTNDFSRNWRDYSTGAGPELGYGVGALASVIFVPNNLNS